MNEPSETVVQAIQVFEPAPGQFYSLDAVAYLTGLSRRAILLYCRSGLIQPAVEPRYGSLLFDETAIRNVRQAEKLRDRGALSRTGVTLLFNLLREVDALRQELRFYRGF